MFLYSLELENSSDDRDSDDQMQDASPHYQKVKKKNV